MTKVKIKACPACKVSPSIEEGYYGSESCVACINSKCPVSLVDEVSVSHWNEQPDGGFEKLIDMVKTLIGNYQVAASIADHEGYETQYAQDSELVKLLLAELKATS